MAKPLAPATPDAFAKELTACLALVAPTGMDQSARTEWLKAARITLGHLPEDMLAAGCRKAREIADHPAKIIPAIMAETAEWLEMRRSSIPAQPMIEGPAAPRSANALMDARGKPMTNEETEVLNRHLEWLGSSVRYRSDGARDSNSRSESEDAPAAEAEGRQSGAAETAHRPNGAAQHV